MFKPSHFACGRGTPEVMTSLKAKVSDLNSHLLCVLCGGYLIDATTIIECLHSFCRSCIVRYIEASQYCPVCDTELHSSKPHLSLKPDYTLQDLVYKLIPKLFTGEANRRKEFLRQHLAPEENAAMTSQEVDDVVHSEMTHGELFYTEDENISVCLEYSENGHPNKDIIRDPNNNKDHKKENKFLLCPAPFTIKLLKKFLRSKFELPLHYKIDVFHTSDPLSDDYTLMDVAYIYTWRRTGPLHLFYSVYETKPKLTCRVSIRLPPGLAKRQSCAMHSSSSNSGASSSGFRIRTKKPTNTTSEIIEDTKEGIEERIHKFMTSRRSKAFKARNKGKNLNNGTGSEHVPATTTCTVTQSMNSAPSSGRTTIPNGVRIKQEIMSDCDSPVTPPPTPKKMETGSLKVRIPRYMIRGYPYTLPLKRKYSSGNSSRDDRSSPESDSRQDSDNSSLRLYDFTDEEEFAEPRQPKIIRRRYSDSSWSSEM